MPNAPEKSCNAWGIAISGKNPRLEAIVKELLLELGVDIHDQHFRARRPALHGCTANSRRAIESSLRRC